MASRNAKKMLGVFRRLFPGRIGPTGEVSIVRTHEDPQDPLGPWVWKLVDSQWRVLCGSSSPVYEVLAAAKDGRVSGSIFQPGPQQCEIHVNPARPVAGTVEGRG